MKQRVVLVITGSVFFNAAAEQIVWVGFFGWISLMDFFFFSFFFSFASVGIRKFSKTNVKPQWNGSMNKRTMKGSLWHHTYCPRGKVGTSTQILYIYIKRKFLNTLHV